MHKWQCNFGMCVQKQHTIFARKLFALLKAVLWHCLRFEKVGNYIS